MEHIKTLLVLLFCFCLCVQVAFSQDTYYLTNEQLTNLTKQIDKLRLNNEDMMILLENQKKELDNQKNELDKQMKESQTLEKNYLEKFQLMEKQNENYRQLLNKSESRNSIYKYSIGIAFAVGVILGVFVAK